MPFPSTPREKTSRSEVNTLFKTFSYSFYALHNLACLFVESFPAGVSPLEISKAGGDGSQGRGKFRDVCFSFQPQTFDPRAGRGGERLKDGQKAFF